MIIFYGNEIMMRKIFRFFSTNRNEIKLIEKILHTRNKKKKKKEKRAMLNKYKYNGVALRPNRNVNESESTVV